MMGKLIARQYYQRPPGLTRAIRRNLVWRYSALGNLPPMTTPYSLGTPVGAHTDSEGLGHIDAVYLDSEKTTASTHLPKWFLELVNDLPNESPIFLFEMCAAILMVCCSSGWENKDARTCELRVGNKAAVEALVKGSSSPPAGALLANLFWTLATHGSIIWWIEYVHTKSNSADGPSRDCTALLGDGCSRNTGNVPQIFAHAFSPWEAIHREATIVKQK